MAIIIYTIVGVTIFFALFKGKGKEKIWAAAPIGMYVLVSIVEALIFNFFFGTIDIDSLQGTPIPIIISAINTIIFISLSFWIIRRIQKNHLKRIEKEIDNL